MNRTDGGTEDFIDTSGTAPDDLIGKMIGAYRVESMLGTGAFGMVFQAADTRLDNEDAPRRRVAIKILHPRWELDPSIYDRFEHEIDILQRVSHRNVVQVFDRGKYGSLPYYTMELLYDSLESRLTTNLRPRDIVGWMSKIARGLDALHRDGVVHRDVKPGNILFDAAGEPKLIDLGIARKKNRSTAVAPSAEFSRSLGSPPYQAPEQLGRKHGEISVGTDVWAIGTILYEGIHGQLPFDASDRIGFADDAREADPPQMRTDFADLPRDIEWVCRKCLEKSSKRRYRSASELADDLERILRGDRSLARPHAIRWYFERKWRMQPALMAALSLGLVMATPLFVITIVIAMEIKRMDALNIQSESRDPALRIHAIRHEAEKYQAAMASLKIDHEQELAREKVATNREKKRADDAEERVRQFRK